MNGILWSARHAAARKVLRFGVSAWLVCAVAHRVQAQDGARTTHLRVEAGGGVATHASVLPGARGDRRVDPAPVPAVAADLLLLHAVSERLRLGAQLAYQTSLDYELSSPGPLGPEESADARKQELTLLGRAGFALGRLETPPTLAVLLGYGLLAFSLEPRVGFAPSYVLSGPRAGCALRLPWPAARLTAQARFELGANVSTSSELRAAGVERFGLGYAWQVQAEGHLTPAWSLGAKLRTAHVSLPLASSGHFEDTHRFVVAFVSVRAGAR